MGSARRILLRAVAALLILSAALAIGILLIGRMGETEGRILGTTAVLAGYGLVAVPATVLLDQGRWARWATANVVLIVAAATVSIVSIWGASDSDWLGKTVGTLTVFALATTQVSALEARRQERDPPVVRRLFVLSSVLVLVAATAFAGMLWAESGGPAARFLGALVIADLLCVALQPVLARLRAAGAAYELVVFTKAGVARHVSVEAPNLAAAAAKAIRTVEHEGGDVVEVKLGASVR